MRCRDFQPGHRDAIPEGTLEAIRWARNLLIETKKNAWDIPPSEIIDLQVQYLQAINIWDQHGPEPLSEPHPIDGFTIYWDRAGRYVDLLCGFLGIPLNKDGSFDGNEFFRRLQAGKDDPQRIPQWKEYLMGHVERNAALFNMPPEWVEGVRARVFNMMFNMQASPLNDNSDGMQQHMMLIFHEFH